MFSVGMASKRKTAEDGFALPLQLHLISASFVKGTYQATF